MNVFTGPRIFIIIPVSTCLFISTAHLEKYSSFLSKVKISQVHTKPHLPLQSYLSSNLQSPRTQKASQLPRIVPSSVGQEPGEQVHSLIHFHWKRSKHWIRVSREGCRQEKCLPFFQGSNFGPLEFRFKSFPDHTPAEFFHNFSQV